MHHQNFSTIDEFDQQSELDLQNELDKLLELAGSETKTSSTTNTTAARNPYGEFWQDMFGEKIFDDKGFSEEVVVEEGNVKPPVFSKKISHTNILGIDPFAHTSFFTPHSQDFRAVESEKSASISHESQKSAPLSQEKFMQIDFSKLPPIFNNKALLVKHGLKALVLTFELNDQNQYVCDCLKNPSIAALKTSRDKADVFTAIKLKLANDFKGNNTYGLFKTPPSSQTLILDGQTANAIKNKKSLKFFDFRPVENPVVTPTQTSGAESSLNSSQRFFNSNKRSGSFDESSTTTPVVNPSVEPSTQDRINSYMQQAGHSNIDSFIESLDKMENKRRKK